MKKQIFRPGDVVTAKLDGNHLYQMIEIDYTMLNGETIWKVCSLNDSLIRFIYDYDLRLVSKGEIAGKQSGIL